MQRGMAGVFGGQMIGQALVACKSTVSRDYPIHSLHCYFVDRGDPNIPISYRVSSYKFIL